MGDRNSLDARKELQNHLLETPSAETASLEMPRDEGALLLGEGQAFQLGEMLQEGILRDSITAPCDF